jgi:hypothetical protein
MTRVGEWVLGIVGAVATFLGLFILYAGEDHYLGLFGWSWRVGDIAAAWGYGLLIGGIALLAIALALVVHGVRRPRVH